MILLLLACGPLGLEQAGGTKGDSASTSAVVISGVDPVFGPVDGGTVVTLTGAGFDGAVTVSFGSAEVTATRIDSTTLIATTPAAGVEVTVDVTVTSDLGVGTLEGAFTYTDDTRPPDDSGTSGAEGTAAMVELSLLQIACPACFGSTSELDIYASAAFHDPIAASWTDWLPAVGSCTTNGGSVAPTSSFRDAGEWVYLNAGSRSIGLGRVYETGGPTYQASGVAYEQWSFNSGYDLDVGGGADVADFSVDDVVTTPQGFSSILPQELLYTQPNQAFAARLSRAGATFSWEPAGGSGSFVILLGIYSANGASFLGTVLCRGADNGSMTIPSAYLGAFPSGSLVAAYLYRYAISTFALPDGTTGDSIANTGVVGTGVLQ